MSCPESTALCDVSASKPIRLMDGVCTSRFLLNDSAQLGGNPGVVDATKRQL